MEVIEKNLPKGWDIDSLSNLVNVVNGKAHEPYVVDYAGPYVVVNSKFVSSEGAVRKYCSKNITPARKDDVLMVLSDLPNGKALAKCFYTDRDNIYAVNQRVCAFRAGTKIHSKYLHYKLNRNKYFLKFDDGVSQTHLLVDTVNKCPLVFPESKDEQKAIADTLTDIDNYIAALDKLIEKKKKIKTATVQQLLSGEKQLENFSNKRTNASLGDFGSCIRGVSYDGQSDLHQNSGNQTKTLLRANNVQAGQIVLQDMQYVSKARVSDVQILKHGDLLVCMANGSKELVGKAGMVKFNSDTFTFGAFMGVYRVHSTELSPEYVDYLLQSFAFRKHIKNLLAGSSINNLRPSNIEDFSFEKPDIEEQKAIVELLNGQTNGIAVLTKKREKWLKIKEGAMHELLTGKIRLV